MRIRLLVAVLLSAACVPESLAPSHQRLSSATALPPTGYDAERYAVLPGFIRPITPAVSALTAPSLSVAALGITGISISQPLDLPSPAGPLLSSFAYGAATDGQTGGEAFNGTGYKATHWAASGSGALFDTDYFGWVADINANGSAAVFLQPGPGVLGGGGFTLLSGLPNCNPNNVQAISNSGYVVGTCIRTDDAGPLGYVIRAMRWDPAGNALMLVSPPSPVDGLGALVHTVATDVNETGAVAGYGVYESGSLPLLWSSSGALTVLDAGVLGKAQAYGINDDGAVVGLSLVQGTYGEEYHAVKWMNGALTFLGMPDPTSSFSRGWRINNDGFVLGYSDYTGGQNAIWAPDGTFVGILPGAGWAEDLEGRYIAGYRVVDWDAVRYAGVRWTLNYSTGPSYSFSGFFQPVDNAPILNRVKAGSAVPVKFGLGGDQGLDVFASGSPGSKQINCGTGAGTDDIEQTTTAGASSLTYDPSTGRYTYVWKTEKAWTGTCRQLMLSLKDGTVQVALFTLVK
jgi:probable HAF family extracellular repeat protein